MAGNSFGSVFKLTTFGESHGVAIGGVIDGCIYGISPKIIESKDLLIITQTWRRNGNQLYSGDHVLIEEAKMDKIETKDV